MQRLAQSGILTASLGMKSHRNPAFRPGLMNVKTSCICPGNIQWHTLVSFLAVSHYCGGISLYSLIDFIHHENLNMSHPKKIKIR